LRLQGRQPAHRGHGRVRGAGPYQHRTRSPQAARGVGELAPADGASHVVKGGPRMAQMTSSPEPLTSGRERGAADRDTGYFNLLSFIVSNAIAGEIMAVENYSQMVHLMPTTEAKIETVNQAKEESKHILLLSKLGRTLEFAVARQIVEPQWNN